MMKLYHGSNVKIEKIDLSKSRPFKGRYINKDRFLQKLKLMRGITFQFAFCTESAILKLKKL